MRKSGNGGVIFNQKKRKAGFGGGGYTKGIEGCTNSMFALAHGDTCNVHSTTDGRTWDMELKSGITVAQADLPQINQGKGSYFATVCQQNKEYRYIVMDAGWMLCRRGAGQQYVRAQLPALTGLNANDGDRRLGGQPLAVDPVNGLHVLYHDYTGYFVTADGFASPTTAVAGIPAVPTAQAGAGGSPRGLLAFDTTVPPVNGEHKQVWMLRAGAGGGLYKSTDGGRTFPTKIADAPNRPTDASHLRIAPNGEVWLVGSQNTGGGEGTIRVYHPSNNTWTEIDCPAKDVIFPAGKPAGTAWIVSFGARPFLSTNSQTVIGSQNSAIEHVVTDVPWFLYAADRDFMGVSAACQMSDGTILIGTGIGPQRLVQWPDTPGFGSTIKWTDSVTGLDNCIGILLEANPEDGAIGAAQMDRGGHVYPPGTIGRRFPSSYGANAGFNHGQGISYVPGKPGMWRCCGNGNLQIGTTFDYGRDGWKGTNSLVDQIKEATGNISGGNSGGQIVCLDENTTLCIQLGARVDAGTADEAWQRASNLLYVNFEGVKKGSWQSVMLGSNTYVSGSFYYYLARRTLTRDPFNPYTAYFYNAGGGGADQGLFKLVANPATKVLTVTKVFDGLINDGGLSSDFYHGKLKVIAPGVIAWCAGLNADVGLAISTNGGPNMSHPTSTDNLGLGDRFGHVWCFDGRPVNGQNVLLVLGFRKNGANGNPADPANFGLWRSVDLGATYTRIDTRPGGIYDDIMDLVVDPIMEETYALAIASQGIQGFINENDLILT